MRRQSHRRGYALIMTVVLIAIAALLMAGVARQGLQLAAQASAAQADLQRRWGVFSCQRAVLCQAEEILARQEAAQREADGRLGGIPAVATEMRLGTMSVALLLADENAKVSLNAIHARRDKETVARVVQEMAGLSGLDVRLRPYRRAADAEHLPAFDSWGQVFALEEGRADTQAPKSLAAATAELTCWGDGKLNLRRASRDALERVCRLEASPTIVGRLLELMSKPSPWKLAGLLDQLRLAEGERQRLEQLLTDRSLCHSLWIVATTQERTSTALYVAQSTGGDQAVETTAFLW